MAPARLTTSPTSGTARRSENSSVTASQPGEITNVLALLLTIRQQRRVYHRYNGGLIFMADAEERPADGRRSTRWTVADVLGAVGRAGDDAAEIARTVSDWATLPNFGITGGAGLTYPSFTVLADITCTTGAGLRGILSLYADSHGSGPALEVRVNEMYYAPIRPSAGSRSPDSSIWYSVRLLSVVRTSHANNCSSDNVDAHVSTRIALKV
jgi:hypothetical protein